MNPLQHAIHRDTQKAEQGARYIAPFVLLYLDLSLIGSAALTLSARKTPYYEIDLLITRRLQAFRPAWFDRLMGLVCNIGYPVQANTLGFLVYLVRRSRLPRLVRLPLYGFLGGTAILMGPARIYSGEHWASDVLAGYWTGSCWLALVVKFHHWGKPFYSKPSWGKRTWQRRST